MILKIVLILVVITQAFSNPVPGNRTESMKTNYTAIYCRTDLNHHNKSCGKIAGDQVFHRHDNHSGWNSFKEQSVKLLKQIIEAITSVVEGRPDEETTINLSMATSLQKDSQDSDKSKSDSLPPVDTIANSPDDVLSTQSPTNQESETTSQKKQSADPTESDLPREVIEPTTEINAKLPHTDDVPSTSPKSFETDPGSNSDGSKKNGKSNEKKGSQKEDHPNVEKKDDPNIVTTTEGKVPITAEINNEETVTTEKLIEEENLPTEKFIKEENLPTEKLIKEENLPTEKFVKEENLPTTEKLTKEYLNSTTGWIEEDLATTEKWAEDPNNLQLDDDNNNKGPKSDANVTDVPSTEETPDKISSEEEKKSDEECGVKCACNDIDSYKDQLARFFSKVKKTLKCEKYQE